MNINYLSYNKLNYSLININNNGLIFYNNKKWNSKKEFYNLFGDSEEFIIYPITEKIKKINYIHYNTQVLKHTIEGIKALLSLNYDILIYTNVKNKFKNLKVPCSLFDLDNFNNNNNNYIELNDSLIFPCCELSIFELELNNKKLIKSVKNLSTKEKNKYINFLKMYH